MNIEKPENAFVISTALPGFYFSSELNFLLAYMVVKRLPRC